MLYHVFVLVKLAATITTRGGKPECETQHERYAEGDTSVMRKTPKRGSASTTEDCESGRTVRKGGYGIWDLSNDHLLPLTVMFRNLGR